ncbi:MAG: hypothetical protein QF673_02875 [Candidatus Hydrothermarchaeota archaeon]|nr:hypothetical protein [Candidatus Hydrothermarchaeota archaeon]
MEQRSTRWSIIASGEGANRICLQYYSRFLDSIIGDKVLLLNTSPADVNPEKTFEYIITKDEKIKRVFEEIKRERICVFGKSPSGAGNNWKIGENEAREDFDTIRRYIANLNLGGRDVILGITTLGGGTGNGSLPYIIHRLKTSRTLVSNDENSYTSVGILPYDFEAPQRYFNTICGLTRLLKYGPRARQNADMVLLVDNSQIETMLNASESLEEERYYLINQEIIKAIRMMIAPSVGRAKSTIDIADYYQLPRNIGVYHFTPCLSLDNDPEIFEIETALDAATQNPMAPLDPKTAIMAYIIAIVPQKYVDEGKFSQEDLEAKSYEWAVRNMAGKWGGIMRYSSLVSTPDQENLDLMILLGGYSLKDILAKCLQKYYDFIDVLEIDKGETELFDEDRPEIKTKIRIKDIENIEANLKEYITVSESKIEKTQKAETDLTVKLEEFGFGKRKG